MGEGGAQEDLARANERPRPSAHAVEAAHAVQGPIVRTPRRVVPARHSSCPIRNETKQPL